MKSEGKTRDAEMDRLRALWETTSFRPWRRRQKEMARPGDDSGHVERRCPRIRPCPTIEGPAINGEAADIPALQPAGEKPGHGCYLIAVGGDKLSEGLPSRALPSATSYARRKIYDTLHAKMAAGLATGQGPERLYTTQGPQRLVQQISRCG